MVLGDPVGEGEIDESMGEAGGVLVPAVVSMPHSSAGTNASAVIQQRVTARLPRGFGDGGPNHARLTRTWCPLPRWPKPRSKPSAPNYR